MRIFIGYSGETGMRVASAFNNWFEGCFEHVTPVYFPQPKDSELAANEAREAFKLKVEEEAAKADMAIFSLGRNPAETQYVQWEIGLVTTAIKAIKSKEANGRRIFVFELCDIPEDNTEPFREHLCKLGCEKTKKNLLQAVLADANCSWPGNGIPVELFWNSLSNHIAKQDLGYWLERGGFTGDAKVDGHIREIVGTVGAFAQEGLKEMAKVRGVKGIVYDYVESRLAGASADLKALRKGDLPLERDNVRRFWEKSIMGKVESKIWTTNMVMGSFGREINPESITTQRSAVKRNVNFTRIFIYDDDVLIDPQSRNRLLELLLVQSLAGIKVYAIESKTFLAIAEDVDEKVGGADFMVLDNEAIYITKTNKERTEVVATELIAKWAPGQEGGDKIENAIELAKKIEPHSEAIKPKLVLPEQAIGDIMLQCVSRSRRKGIHSGLKELRFGKEMEDIGQVELLIRNILELVPEDEHEEALEQSVVKRLGVTEIVVNRLRANKLYVWIRYQIPDTAYPEIIRKYKPKNPEHLSTYLGRVLEEEEFLDLIDRCGIPEKSRTGFKKKYLCKPQWGQRRFNIDRYDCPRLSDCLNEITLEELLKLEKKMDEQDNKMEETSG